MSAGTSSSEVAMSSSRAQRPTFRPLALTASITKHCDSRRLGDVGSPSDGSPTTHSNAPLALNASFTSERCAPSRISHRRWPTTRPW